MVMFCVTELSFKVSLFSIVVDEEEEDGGVKEFKIDSNGISVLIIEKKLIDAIIYLDNKQNKN